MEKDPETILVVEDSDTVLDLVRMVLEFEGYNVLSARDGEEALRVCRGFEGRIRLVLSDMIMPNMSGSELGERVRALLPGTKILFMSGHTGEELMPTGEPFLQKPFTPAALAEKVRGILDADPAS